VIILMTFLLAHTIGASQARSGVDASFVLPNGLKIIAVQQPGNPTVTALLIVKAGSSSESGESEYGLAHLMEHMAFKGTHKRGVGEVSAEIENLGGSINAYTSNDNTVYYVTMPVEGLETGLDILSDITFNPSYDPAEYALEKEVVVEEIKRSLDSPESKLWYAVVGETFKNHPYAHPILGSPESVREAGRDTALAFHDKFYRPDNAVLVVTGGFAIEGFNELVEKYLAGVAAPGAPLPPAPAAGPNGLDAPTILEVRHDMVRVPKVMVAFRAPPGGDPESEELDLLSSVLDGGRSSRLPERVKTNRGLVTDISSFYLNNKLGGLFAVDYETEEGKIGEALAAVVEELNLLCREPVTLEELTRARAQASSSFIQSQESSSSLAGVLTSFELISGDFRLRDAYLTAWSRVTPMDLAVLAERYLRPENLVLGVLMPTDAPPLDVEALKKTVAALAPEIPEGEVLEAGRFQETTLKSGAKLVYLRDASLPMVRINAAARGGQMAEAPGEEGLAMLADKAMVLASLTSPSEETARSIEDLGGVVSGVSGRNSMGLRATFMSADWRRGLEIAVDLIRNPAFNEANIEEVRAEQLASIKALDEQISEKTVKLVRSELYKWHPYRHSSLGTAEAVASLDKRRLGEFHETYFRPEYLTFVVSGDIVPEEVAEYLDGLLAGWSPPGEGKKVVVPPPPPPIAGGPVRLSEELDSAQTHLAMAFAAPGLGHPDQAPLEVLDSHLSGMGGVLFNELRNKQSLAYVVYSSYSPGLDAGGFMFYIASDPQKTEQALAGLEEVVAGVRANKLTEEETAQAVRYLTGQYKIMFQTLDKRADDVLYNSLYGLGLDYREKHLERIAAVTPDDILRVAKKYLAPEGSVVAVVGPSGREAASGAPEAPAAGSSEASAK
jgi:zinc protease